MLPTIDNFISYGTDTIKANADYRKMLVDIYTYSLTVDHLGENDRVIGSKIAESILLNLRGAVDDVRTLSFGGPSPGTRLIHGYYSSVVPPHHHQRRPFPPREHRVPCSPSRQP